MYILAGLDSGRYHWSPELHISVVILGAICTVLGQFLFLLAQKQNHFFSSTVRIQTARWHQVCDTGLYKFVRHPAYLGSCIQVVGFPLIMASLWSVIPVAFSLVLLILRTKLEDKTLRDELLGYTEYMKKHDIEFSRIYGNFFLLFSILSIP